MAFVPAIPAPMSDKKQVEFYRRKWQASKDEIKTKNDIIETKIARNEMLVNQLTELNKAIKYLL